MLPWLFWIGLSLPWAEQGTCHFQASPREAAVPAEFRLSDTDFRFEMECRRILEDRAIYSVRFPSPIVSPHPENNTVYAEYHVPHGRSKRPAVVVLHILGGDFALSRFLAGRLASHGVAALFVKLPYYGERRPANLEDRLLSTDLDRSVLSMRQGVCDVRRALSWLASRSEVDPNQLGVTGISLGGIVSAVVAGVDPSVDRAALLLAGGDLAAILWNMPEPGAEAARKAWLDSGMTFEDLVRTTRPFDPLTHAHGLRAKKLLMISGRVDEVIPPSSTIALWEAAGRPELIWYDCGHYSAAGYLIPAINRTARFFASPE